MNITLPHNWVPRPDQLALWRYLQGGGLRAVEVAHRRWGKDAVALNYTAVAAMKRVGNYWHMLPEYKQARKVIWNAINPDTGKNRVDEAFPKEIRKATNKQEMMIELKSGSTWQVVGSDNYNSLIGSPPVGIVFSEWAVADPMCWAYLQPILEQNGGWAVFIYTLRGHNHGWDFLTAARLREDWFAEVLTAMDTPVFTPAQLEKAKQDLVMTLGPELGESVFDQEYMCSADAAVLGAYYGKQLAKARKEGRIARVPHNEQFEVYTFWDLGYDDSTSIWFLQQIGHELRFIDYYENQGQGIAHYAKELKDRPYIYAEHIMPHDAKAGSIQTGKSLKKVAEQLGIRPIRTVDRAQNHDAVRLGIEAGRNWFSQLYFDRDKCARGLSALEGYQARYDEKLKKLVDEPFHNWCSHAADAFRTFAVGYKPQVRVKTVGEILQEFPIEGRW